MIYLTVRTLTAVLKGLAYLMGAILFGVLPLLIAIAWKCLKGGTIATWKVTVWMIGTALAGAVLIAQSARHAHS